MTGRLSWLLETLAALWPLDAEPPDETMDRDLLFLGASVMAPVVLRAGYTTGVFVSALSFLVTVALGITPLGSLFTALLTGLGVVHGIHRAPNALARLERTRALCAASDLVGRLVLRLRLSPALEPAVAFAASTGTDPLARSLDDHRARTRGSPETGLESFAAAWQPWFPALERSTTLLGTAAERPSDEREALYDQALSAVVEATQAEMSSFAAEVRGPATAVYAFGVLLPLALVGVLPAASVAGTVFSLPQLALVYDVILPLGLVGATGWLVVRRPVTFATPAVSVSHPDAQTPWWHVLGASVVTAVLFWGFGTALVGAWLGPVVAVGSGVGAGLVVWLAPAMAVSRRARALEDGLPDALSLVGRDVRGGTSVEAAVEAVGSELSTEAGALFEAAVAVQRRLGTTLERGFIGEFGALGSVPSPRTRAAATLLSIATVEGRPAGEALVSLADQLRALSSAEEAGKRELATVAGTLSNTAAAFGPLVGGATVSLAARIAQVETGTGVAMAFSVPGLGTVLGVYVFVMAATLTTLATGLESGVDPTRIGYRVGIALVLAAATFVTGIAAADLLV